LQTQFSPPASAAPDHRASAAPLISVNPRLIGLSNYEDFTVEKLAPYKPNNFLLFFKTRHSFHSVRDIGDDVPDQRYGMQFQFYEPDNGLFNDLSTPDLMHVRRPHKQAFATRAVKKLMSFAE